MKNLSIRLKILLGFSIVALIVFAIGASLLSRLKSVDNSTREVTSKWLPGYKLASQMQNDFSLMRNNEYKLAFATTKDEKSTIEGDIENLKKSISNNIQLLQLIITSDETKGLYASINAEYPKYIEENDKIIDLSRKYQIDQVKSELLDRSASLYNSIAYNLQKIVEISGKASESASAQVESAYNKTFLLIIAIVAFATVISLIIATYISGIIAKGIKKVQIAAEKIAIGEMDINIDVDRKDEIGKLANAFGNMVDTMKEIADNAKLISNGDLTVTLTKRSENDELIGALAEMVAKLNEIVGQISEAANNVAVSSNEMSGTATQVSQGANEQASSFEEISSSVEEMTTTIQQNSDNAYQTERIAVSSAQGIEEVNRASQNSLEAIRQIVEKIKVINNIAEKTDILAINAAIEAARAGEHGKGFAVVAAEVRKLAETSQKAAIEINHFSAGSLKTTEETTELMSKIIPDIQRTAQLVQEIAVSSMEQSTGAGMIANAIEQLSNVTQQNSASSEEMSSTSEELASQAEMLKETISFFKTNNQSKHGINRASESKNSFASTVSKKKKSSSNKGVDLMIETDTSDKSFEHY